MVGDPGIEPGMGLPGGVTVRCRTLQLVTHTKQCFVHEGLNIAGSEGRQQENRCLMTCTCFLTVFDALKGGENGAKYEEAKVGYSKRTGQTGRGIRNSMAFRVTCREGCLDEPSTP